MAYVMKSFKGSLSVSWDAFATAINAYFVANPAIRLLDMTVERFTSDARSQKVTVRLLLDNAYGVQYSAAVVNGTASSTLTTQVAAWSAANPTAHVLYAHELAEFEGRKGVKYGSILLLYTTADIRKMDEVVVAEPIAQIGLGGTVSGAAKIYNSAGAVISASTAVVNGSLASNWVALQRNYAVTDPATGLLIGLPSCSGAGALP